MNRKRFFKGMPLKGVRIEREILASEAVSAVLNDSVGIAVQPTNLPKTRCRGKLSLQMT